MNLQKPSRLLARRSWVTALCLTLSGLTGHAWAQAPNAAATVKLIVGYAAGGPVDSAARVFAPVLSRELGQPVIVENRAGAGGAVAGNSVVKAAPNGLELFFAASPTMTISPHVLKAMTFDPLKDLAPLATILSYANVLVINQNQPFKTVPELVAYAKANPGKLAYGSAGMGASNHLSGELFARRAGVTMTHVPYKGNAPAMTDVMGGQIQMMFDIVGGAKTYIDGGKVRALAVTSKERNPAFPQLPSMTELGIRDYDVGGWYGLYGPLGMGAEASQKITAATARALQDAELNKRWVDQGYVIWNNKPADLAERMRREHALWAEVTKGMTFE
ncbi:tripartite tricarboxylate transporter substrate binding protein [Limnohabitans sp.]|jgi:tripartite-type tricarboxylate transporter receptor subunit TctC|uniref:Bug family tripartite tricarboxylate transporter substrate binding protein n=1 Tax=Limnohabitans sp. TaxID=1907725 RepID=UPI00260D044C|nr:tripartite tricarboxylate transporter substrate binding protein [Limnohabitans sp.]